MKRLYSILVLIAFNNLSFSQLSVRNDTYVFVNDEIVFVEDDVNLNEADSKIYLRSEGQLIQGSGTTGNSGLGELSLYQNGNVGSYEYNYWCSPIGDRSTNNTTNNIFGISFLNDISSITNATPATYNHASNYNGTANPLNIEPYWIWKYITSDTYADWIHVEGNTTINPGEGFTMKGTAGTSLNNSGDNQMYDFRGKPNTGTIGINVLPNQFTLVGNPYASALDALAYIHDAENKTVITGTLHLWEQNPNINSHLLRAYDGGYATYTISADGLTETYVQATFYTYKGDGTINGTTGTSPSGKRPRRYMPIGQGFMVEGTAMGKVKAKNSHRVYAKETASDSEFFKTSNTKKSTKTTLTNNGFSIIHSDYKRFRLNIDFNNIYTRQLVETFHASATNGFDYGLESKINIDGILNSDAYLSNNKNTYIAEALPFDETLKMPIVIKLTQDMPIRIRITDIQNFDNTQPIYIHDIDNNTYTDLRTQDFNINLKTGTHNNRLEITFNKSTLDIKDNTFENLKIFHNNISSELIISNPNNLDIKNISLFDISGKRIINKSNLTYKTGYTYSTKSLSDGVYIAKINLVDNKVFSKKIIVTRKE